MFKAFFYFIIPYFFGWIFLWCSLPVVKVYRRLLLWWLKRMIEGSPAVGYEDPDGNFVVKWHVFTIKYSVSKERETGKKTVRYVSVKERLSSTEASLHDLERFFDSCTLLAKRHFFKMKEK